MDYADRAQAIDPRYAARAAQKQAAMADQTSAYPDPSGVEQTALPAFSIRIEGLIYRALQTAETVEYFADRVSGPVATLGQVGNGSKDPSPPSCQLAAIEMNLSSLSNAFDRLETAVGRLGRIG